MDVRCKVGNIGKCSIIKIQLYSLRPIIYDVILRHGGSINILYYEMEGVSIFYHVLLNKFVINDKFGEACALYISGQR